MLWYPHVNAKATVSHVRAPGFESKMMWIATLSSTSSWYLPFTECEAQVPNYFSSIDHMFYNFAKETHGLASSRTGQHSWVGGEGDRAVYNLYVYYIKPSI